METTLVSYIFMILAVATVLGRSTPPLERDLSELETIIDSLSKRFQAGKGLGATSQLSELQQAGFQLCISNRQYIWCGPKEGGVCISPKRICDGFEDCRKGGHDENPKLCRKLEGIHKRANKAESKTKPAANEIEKRGQYDTCPTGKVKCGFGTQCVRIDQLCDGVMNCHYERGWDERPENCGTVQCPSGMVKCNATGQCIRHHQLCDDKQDCPDSEDESVQRCGNKHCASSCTICPYDNLCLDNAKWCDGKEDCPNGGDETPHTCRGIPCAGFRCDSSGQCLPLETRCNNFPDCADGSDEDRSKCGPVRCPANSEQCGSANYCYQQPSWGRCDGYEDCPNGADEYNCPERPPVEIASWESAYNMYKKENIPEPSDDIP